MFVDPIRHDVWDKIRQRDLRAFAPWLTREVIAQAALSAGVSLGGGPLCLFVLAWLAIACALHPTKSFASVLGLALKLMRNDPAWDPGAFAPHVPTTGRTSRRRAKPRSQHDPRGSGDPFQLKGCTKR
jgi:hypothetical protein